VSARDFLRTIGDLGFALLSAAALLALLYTGAAWWARWAWWRPPPSPRVRKAWQKRNPWRGGDWDA
jgi:hypothetical protein